MLPSICFVTAHPNPANHFVEYVQSYEEKGIDCKVIAGKNVSEKFAQVKSKVVVIDPTSLEDEELMTQIEPEIASQSIVITDIANERWIALQQNLSEKHPSIKRAVYYDNPERYVPGGYSELASKIIDKAQFILFANTSLVHKGIQSQKGVSIGLSQKSMIGIGYYPKSDAQKILQIKNNQKHLDKIRSSLFEKNSLSDRNQKIFVYTGGANDEYYNKAFPHFIKLVSELTRSNNSLLKDTILILQQHPRAKAEGNLDANLVKNFLSSQELPKGFSFIISDLPTTESLAIADGVFYYQTSMAAQFVFAEIPYVIQIGHDTYTDLLVEAGFPSVTNPEQLTQILSSKASSGNVQLLERELGIDPEWKENLLKIVH
jgi:hypothetical protein